MKSWADKIDDPYPKISPAAAERYSDEAAAKARA
jgi:hypothetical protein